MSLLQLPALLWLLAPVPVADAAVAARWRGPPECPDREALLTAVARRLGRPLAAGEVTIDADVSGDVRGGYTLHLVLTAGARGETREVHDASCTALTDAAALRVVAVLAAASLVPPVPVDEVTSSEPAHAPGTSSPSSLSSLPSLSSSPTIPAVAPAVPSVAPVVIRAPEEPVPRDSFERPGGVLRLHGGGELGAVPGVTGAVGLALGLLWPRLRLELQGTVLAPRTARLSTGTIRAGLFAGAVHACGRLGRGALEVPLCAGLELGAMRAEARGLPGSQAATAVWFAGVLGPGLAWHIGGRVSVWASLQLVLAPVRPVFTRGEGGANPISDRPALASGRLLVGVELRLRDPW